MRRTSLIATVFASIAAWTATLLTPTTSLAYFETMNNANVTPNGTLRVFASPQFGLSRHTGMNINGMADFGLGKNSDGRFAFGLGAVDFSFGGFYKWAPVPDIKGQPGMGLIGGVSYANIDDSNEFSIQLHPILSETINSKWGVFTPHLALPLAIMSRSGETDTPINLAIGTEFKPHKFKMKNMSFMSELSLNLKDSYTTLTLAAIWSFDDITIIKLRTRRGHDGSHHDEPVDASPAPDSEGDSSAHDPSSEEVHEDLRGEPTLEEVLEG